MLVTWQLILIVWHLPSFRSDIPYLWRHEDISYDAHFPLSLSPLFRGAVRPPPPLLRREGSPLSPGLLERHPTILEHAPTTFDPSSDTWHTDHPSQTCIVCGLHHEAWSCEETGSEEHMRMRIVKLI